jgi:hypothetical protein
MLEIWWARSSSLAFRHASCTAFLAPTTFDLSGSFNAVASPAKASLAWAAETRVRFSSAQRSGAVRDPTLAIGDDAR